MLTGLTLVAGYANKARCVGPEFDAQGRSGPDFTVRANRDVCYSDIQKLWLGRDIDLHVFPYLTGSITPEGELRGGTVEYPVLSGLLMWVAAVPSHTDGEFLVWSALLMAPFGLVTGWLLGRLAALAGAAVGARATAGALRVPQLGPAGGGVRGRERCTRCTAGARRARWRDRAVVAAVLLGLGFAFKLYPGAFVAPLALLVLTAPGRGAPPDWRGALRVVAAAVRTVVLVNLPFAIAGYEGWRASFTFQELRKVDITTNSIWYWGFRPWSEPTNLDFQAMVDRLSPVLVLASFTVALAVGWQRWRRGGRPTRGSGSAPRCCAGSCCCTRCTRRSTRCGCCRSSCCCGCAGAGSSRTCWPTSRCTSASSGCSTCSTPGSTSASGAGSPPRPWRSACGVAPRCWWGCSS